MVNENNNSGYNVHVTKLQLSENVMSISSSIAMK